MNIVQSAFRTWRMFVIRLFPEGFNYPSEFPELCLAENPYPSNIKESADPRNLQSILDDIIGNGFLWAVPKHRRSLEKRMTRRMGFGKMILPKNNLVVCDACGHFHPVHTICGNCYEKVQEETKLMQDAIFNELKLDPIDKEVVIVYENDPKEHKTSSGKRIVELPKERPNWFSKNLLTKDSEIPRRKTNSVSDIPFSPEVHNTTT